MSEKEIGEVLNRMGNEVVSLVATSRNLGENYARLVELLGAPSGNGHKEGAGFRDRLITEHRDKDGNLISRRDSGWQEHECLTNTGFASVAGLLLTDIGDVAYDYLAIGTGAVAADPTDATLGGEEARKAGTGTRQTTAVANDTAQVIATFAAADGLAGVDAITEVGLFNATPAGTMLMRLVFAVQNIDWDSGDTYAVTVQIIAQQGA